MAALYYNHSTLTVKQSQANCLTTRLATPSKRFYFPVSPLDGSVLAVYSMKIKSCHVNDEHTLNTYYKFYPNSMFNKNPLPTDCLTSIFCAYSVATPT